MKITFKENTTEAIRQASLNFIEKSILDTIAKLQNTYKDFNPSISRIRISVRDSLHYQIIVASVDQATAPPLCTCANGCKICRIAKENMRVMPHSTPEFAIGDIIDTIIDAEPLKAKGDPVNK